jgi:hypothetical protein
MEKPRGEVSNLGNEVRGHRRSPQLVSPRNRLRSMCKRFPGEYSLVKGVMGEVARDLS